MVRTIILLVASILGTAATTGAVHAQDDTTPAPAPGATPVVEPTDPDAAAAYCVEQGGEVRERVAVLNTSLPSEQRVELGAPQRFCEFTGGEGADPDTWISISLDTLYTQSPTLATLAYLTLPPMTEMTGGSNPSAAYCVHLGGAYAIGAGGGWVTSDPAPAIEVQNYCVFADGSMIDAWGLTYHTGNVIRGLEKRRFARLKRVVASRWMRNLCSAAREMSRHGPGLAGIRLDMTARWGRRCVRIPKTPKGRETNSSGANSAGCPPIPVACYLPSAAEARFDTDSARHDRVGFWWASGDYAGRCSRRNRIQLSWVISAMSSSL